MGQISKFMHWRENFAPEHDVSGLESIPLREISTILAAHGQKLHIGRFDRRASKFWF